MKQKVSPFYTHPDFQLFHARFKVSATTQWNIQGDLPVSLFFYLMGPSPTLSINLQPVSDAPFLGRRKANMLYRGKAAAQLSWNSNLEVEFIEIRLRTSYLASLVNVEPDAWAKKFHLTTFRKQYLYGKEPWSMLPVLTRVVSTLTQTSLRPMVYKDLIYEARTMETVAYFLGQILQPVALPYQLSDVHTKLAVQAQKHIDNIKGKKQFTIISLADQLGTNETTLKQAFKATFGQTIFRYYQDKNLQAAKEALEAGRPVTEVALQCGYTHLSHFSVAFKKEFGVPPSRFV